MTDLFDDDLFAPRPVAKAVAQPEAKIAPVCQPPRPAPAAPTGHAVTSYACPCGYRDEVRGDCPAVLDCVVCGGTETLARLAPRYEPPAGSGRLLTAIEIRAIKLDGK